VQRFIAPTLAMALTLLLAGANYGQSTGFGGQKKLIAQVTSSPLPPVQSTVGEATPEQALELLRLSLTCEVPIRRKSEHNIDKITQTKIGFTGDSQTYSHRSTIRTKQGGQMGTGIGASALTSEAVTEVSGSAKFSLLDSVSIIPETIVGYEKLPGIRLSCKADSKCFVSRWVNSHTYKVGSQERNKSRDVSPTNHFSAYDSAVCDEESARNAKMALEYLIQKAGR
jgi:hypothetical protein